MQETTQPKSEVMAHLGGLPIYADQVRRLVDAATELQPHNWRPANVAAQKLFRCVECLRDIEVMLKSAGRSVNQVKRRRKLKIMLTPLHSLAEACRDLLNDLECNPGSFCRFPQGVRDLLPHMRSQLLRNVPINKGGLLSTARNKISAHIDRDLSSDEMRTLQSQAEPAQIGLWLHTCVAVIADLIKVPVFFWSCDSGREDAVRILFNEPFVITLGLAPDGKVNRLLGADFIPKPPRYDVVKLLMRVVGSSKWMFGPKDTRITEFTEDKPESPWPKSLRWLPKTGATSGDVKLTTVSSVLPKPFPDDGWVQLIPTNVPFFTKPSANPTS
jgi:hypothetical protein